MFPERSAVNVCVGWRVRMGEEREREGEVEREWKRKGARERERALL